MLDVRERPEFVERALLVGVHRAPRERAEAEDLLAAEKARREILEVDAS